MGELGSGFSSLIPAGFSIVDNRLVIARGLTGNDRVEPEGQLCGAKRLSEQQPRWMGSLAGDSSQPDGFGPGRWTERG